MSAWVRIVAAALLIGAASSRQPAEGLFVPTQNPRHEKFVIFARESNDWKAMVASAWEFDLDKPEAGFVRQAEFARSHWNATRLFYPESDDAPEFVRLQVSDEKGEHGYIVHFYRIDYRSWEVKLLLKTGQVHGLGANPRDVFVSTDQGCRIFDRQSGAMREFEVPLTIVRRFNEDVWLVELRGQATGRSGALFDVQKGRLLEERFNVPAELRDGNVEHRLSPDRRRVAFWDGWYSDDPNIDKIHEGPRVLTTKLHALEFKTGQKRSFAFRSVCRPGSGELVLSAGAASEWSEDGSRVTCHTLAGMDLNSKAQQVVLDATTMEVVDRREPPPWKQYVPWKVRYLPDRLKPHYDALGEANAEHGRRVALAFLRSREIDVKDLMGYDSGLAFSADGKRMLMRLKNAKDFYYGDLEADTLRRLAAPPALANIAMDLHWVSTAP